MMDDREEVLGERGLPRIATIIRSTSGAHRRTPTHVDTAHVETPACVRASIADQFWLVADAGAPLELHSKNRPTLEYEPLAMRLMSPIEIEGYSMYPQWAGS